MPREVQFVFSMLRAREEMCHHSLAREAVS